MAIVGEDSLPRAFVLVNLRLLVSAVVPSFATHVGADELVPCKVVTASSVEFAPKFASAPPASPKAPHSVWFQNAERSSMLSLLEALDAPPDGVDRVTWSLPPDEACPTNVVLPRLLAGREPYEVAGLLV
jgi:hypothetical protein